MAVLLSIPLRFFCLDVEHATLRVFGADFGLSTMFYPLFTIIGLLLFVVAIGLKKGRLFCSHLCPMHMFLEKVNNPKTEKSKSRPRRVWLWSLLFSFLLTEVILSFFQPLDYQIRLMAAGSLPLIGIFAALFLGFLGLFVYYQEGFCKKGCPYGLIQMLLQSDGTRIMQFANPAKTCTNCRGCDEICPMKLRPRFESKTPDCTNCNLCTEACTTELGEGNTLFHLVDPVASETPVA
ncbi:4Fe-4S binding protein [Pontiellaceae bacterium B12219]|nr:4Fe-4S binding protein [Pontiellaceae bacterium B12219]